MRSDTVAHWLAAVAVARIHGCRLRWSGGHGEWESAVVDPDPEYASRLLPASGSERNHLLIVQGRRDPIAGSRRAIEWLLSMPSEQRSSEWDWLVRRHEADAHLVSAPKCADGTWDTYSLGKILPECAGGEHAMSAWLSVLAVIGAGLISAGRTAWPPTRTMHPDAIQTIWLPRPREWISVDEIVRWLDVARSATACELRPMAGRLLSYCSIQDTI